MERIAKETYEGKLKKGALDTAYILKTYDELESATQKGYGASFAKIDKTTGLPAQNVVAMQQNIFRFSGAKNATMLAQINELLSKDGKRPSFADFKREVLKLNPTYNQNYLQAEFQTALQAGKLASQWGEYERNKKLFPNLKYKSQEDDRVREEHERLNGIIKPVDDPFWNSYYPPNGWRCFEPNTLILTEKGWKYIKDIKRGDLVVGGSGHYRSVGEIIVNNFSGELITIFTKGKGLSCTPNHKFLTHKGWMTADSINCGDIIIQIAKVGFFNKIMNAVCNTITIVDYCLMSFFRKR